jgi:hypothetical protein
MGVSVCTDSMNTAGIFSFFGSENPTHPPTEEDNVSKNADEYFSFSMVLMNYPEAQEGGTVFT